MQLATTGPSDPMQYDFGVSSFWSTVKYRGEAENGLVSGSIDKKTILDHTFETHVLENRYLKLTLLPELAGHSSHHLQADQKLDAVVSPRAPTVASN
jgi:hypothetical protein